MKAIIAAIILAFCSYVSFGQNKEYNLPDIHFLKDYQVVLLGEPTHGEGNVFRYKTRLIQYLHDSLGFNLIAFESGIYDLHRAEQLIASNKGNNAKEYLNNSLFSVWMAASDFEPFLNYYNQQKSNLTISGFDCQLTGSYSQKELLPAIITALKKYNPAAIRKINEELLQNCLDHFAEGFDYPAEVPFSEFQAQIQHLIHSLEIIKEKNQEIIWHIQAAQNIAALGEDYYSKKDRVLDEETFKAKDSNLRDSMMAQNLLFLMKQYPNEKIICWGAGTHFMNDPSCMDNDELKVYKPMGMYLKKALGQDKVFNLTFISSGGSYGLVGNDDHIVPKPIPNSIEAQLSTIGRDTFIRLNQPLYKGKDTISYCLEYTPVKAKWSRLFDAFVYLPTFTPATIDISEKDTNAIPQSQESNAQTITGTGIEAKVIDAMTEQPVAGANMVIPGLPYELMSNSAGCFYVPEQYRNDSLFVHCLGYTNQYIRLSRGNKNIFSIIPKKNKLEEVSITARKIDIKEIIRNVKSHWKENYETTPFVQRGFNHLTVINFDTITISDIEAVSDYYAFIPNNFNSKNIDCKEVKIKLDQKQTGKFFNIGDYPFLGSVIEPSEIFSKNPLRNYDFKLKSIQDDPINGTVYVIGFTQRKMNRWLTDTWLVQTHAGEIWIKENNYALLMVKDTLQRDTATLNKWTRKYYGKHIKMGEQKVSYGSDIKQHEQNERAYVYLFNTATKKYYLSYFEDSWARDGYFLDTEKPFRTVSVNTFYSLGGIKKIADKSSLPYRDFKLWHQQQYRSNFWQHFVPPANPTL